MQIINTHNGEEKMLRYAYAVATVLVVLTGCSHPAPDYVSKYTTPVPQPSSTAAAVIDDPYTASAADSDGTRAWPALVTAQLLGQNINLDLQVPANPSSKPPHASSDGQVITKQIREAVLPDTKLVVFFSTISDPNRHAPELSAAIKQGLADARKTAAQAHLMVIGPAWTIGQPPANVLAARASLKTVAAAAGAAFVDPIAENWFTDQTGLFGSDNLTLTDAGHTYLASKMAPLIVQQLQAPLNTVAPPKKKKHKTN